MAAIAALSACRSPVECQRHLIDPTGPIAGPFLFHSSLPKELRKVGKEGSIKCNGAKPKGCRMYPQCCRSPQSTLEFHHFRRNPNLSSLWRPSTHRPLAANTHQDHLVPTGECGSLFWRTSLKSYSSVPTQGTPSDTDPVCVETHDSRTFSAPVFTDP
jgi:hypothetical protein